VARLKSKYRGNTPPPLALGTQKAPTRYKNISIVSFQRQSDRVVFTPHNHLPIHEGRCHRGIQQQSLFVSAHFEKIAP
jgi:hypothetical protein